MIRSYNMTELSQLYGVNYKTFAKWLKPYQQELGKKNGNYYTTLQVKVIFTKLGMPSVAIAE